jgi:hypothetical protein
MSEWDCRGTPWRLRKLRVNLAVTYRLDTNTISIFCQHEFAEFFLFKFASFKWIDLLVMCFDGISSGEAF